MGRFALAIALLLVPGCGPSAASPARPPKNAVAPASTSAAEPAFQLRLATFNIQRLGPKKAGRPLVMAQLASIIRRYDLVAVQEVQDRKGEVPRLLLDEINREEARYAVIVSPRSGREPDDRDSQEQYAYYYRADRLVPDGEHGLFDDSAHDHFQREPHVARFRATDAGVSFVLINVHTKPRAAVQEIAAMEQVFVWAQARYGSERHFIALGDFNAGCGYASEEELDALPIHGQAYDWVVPHSADTNLADSQCPYDRIVVRSDQGNLVVAEWGVDRAFEDRQVSDHWPVWASFRFDSPRTDGPARSR